MIFFINSCIFLALKAANMRLHCVSQHLNTCSLALSLSLLLTHLDASVCICPSSSAVHKNLTRRCQPQRHLASLCGRLPPSPRQGWTSRGRRWRGDGEYWGERESEREREREREKRGLVGCAGVRIMEAWWLGGGSEDSSNVPSPPPLPVTSELLAARKC